MSESAEHISLVHELRRWIADKYLSGDLGLVLSDTAGIAPADRSREIDGYVPDAFVAPIRQQCAIIGEAKTATDLESRHSMEQIEMFLRFCNRARGLLVLAVPWHRVAYMRNTLAQWNRRKGLDVSCCRVLDFLPG